MKTYIVYVNGRETGTIKAVSHNEAERKARKQVWKETDDLYRDTPVVSVAYTEV